MAGYKYTGPLDCTGPLHTSGLKGKTAIVTGGAKGIGQAYARALLTTGCTVVIGDLDEAAGRAFAAEHPGQLHFVRCNVTVWADQAGMFAEAARVSPTGQIHHVVANAGIFLPDEVFEYKGEGPTEPNLSSTDVNVRGPLFTTKLAMHYFIAQNGTTPSPSQQDTSLVLVSSGAGIYDVPRMPEYAASKFAVRGIMHSLRRTAHYYGSRVNVICPYYIETTVLPKRIYDHVKALGVGFATLEDAGQCLLRLVSDPTANGHSLFIAPRKWAVNGYIDLDLEDTEQTELRTTIQYEQMRSEPVEAGLFAHLYGDR